jgi:hypothetical protein
MLSMIKSQPIRIRRSRSLSNSNSYETSNISNLSTSVPTSVPTQTIIEHLEPVPIIEVTPLQDTITITQPIKTIPHQTLTTPNISIKACKNITSKQALLIIPITKFFTNSFYLNKLIEILKGESISLRLVDWFVTNYCKKNNVIYNHTDYKTDQPQVTTTELPSFDNFIIVHSNYKGQLKAYSKRNFDPFCRRNRIRFYYEDGKYFITTVGQLNFFKWALEHGIINYITKHLKEIDEDMNNRCETTLKKQNGTKIASELNTTNDTSTKKKPNDCTITIETAIKTKKTGGTRKKRKEISVSASKSLSIHNYPTTLIFD